VVARGQLPEATDKDETFFEFGSGSIFFDTQKNEYSEIHHLLGITLLYEIQETYSRCSFLHDLVAGDVVGFMLRNDVKQYNEQSLCFCKPIDIITDAGWVEVLLFYCFLVMNQSVTKLISAVFAKLMCFTASSFTCFHLLTRERIFMRNFPHLQIHAVES
jgi:hypothetical protein